MRCLLLVALLALVSCTAQKPPTHAPASAPDIASSELKLPQNEHRRGADPSDVERIYDIAETPGAPMLGANDAKVKVEVCSDFECPYCKQLVPTLHELSENYGELVRILWRNCPLPFHEHALPAAEAAVEVLEQGGSKGFWAYHDQLFAYQGELGSRTLVELAAKVDGVDAGRVQSALADHRHERRVRAELMALVDAGATANGLGTPTVFINGRMISGAQPYRVFEDAVERALQELPADRARAVEMSKQAYPMARVRHILIQYQGAKNAPSQLKRTQEEAALRARTLQQRLTRDRADFAAVAREASDCPSAKDGGELGRFTVGELEPSFELALFALSPGQVSEVVETPFGYHVLLREE
jgi:protein-disulfide isomerase